MASIGGVFCKHANTTHKYATFIFRAEERAGTRVFRAYRGAAVTLVPDLAHVFALDFTSVREGETRSKTEWLFAVDAEVRGMLLFAYITHLTI